jgi:large subunit ribosomal protein L23
MSQYNKVMFKVARGASKPQIKEAVEQLFEVRVEKVNTIVRKGKTKTFRGRKGRLSDVKLAIVTLKDGDRIDISSGV